MNVSLAICSANNRNSTVLQPCDCARPCIERNCNLSRKTQVDFFLSNLYCAHCFYCLCTYCPLSLSDTTQRFNYTTFHMSQRDHQFATEPHAERFRSRLVYFQDRPVSIVRPEFCEDNSFSFERILALYGPFCRSFLKNKAAAFQEMPSNRTSHLRDPY